MKQSIKDIFYFLTNKIHSPVAPLHMALEENHPIYIQIHSEKSIENHSKRTRLPSPDESDSKHIIGSFS
jgi:hypothetical protein